VPEPVQHCPVEKGVESVAGAADGAEGELGELVGGEGVVLIEVLEQEAVAGGDAGQFSGHHGRRQAHGGPGGCAANSDIPYQSVPVHRSSSAWLTCAGDVSPPEQ
jgi:hypothetical protein